MPGTVNAGMGSGKKKESNAAVIVIVILVTVVVVLGIVVACLLLLGKKDKGTSDEVGNVEGTQRELVGSMRTVVDESSAQSVMDQMREEVAEGMFECQMSMTWTFENGAAESKDAYVANSVNNTHPICFDVYLKDTEELLYSSPVLPVGTDLKNIKLDQELPAGEYKATVMYSLLKDVETQEEVSSAGFVVTIKIQN